MKTNNAVYTPKPIQRLYTQTFPPPEKDTLLAIEPAAPPPIASWALTQDVIPLHQSTPQLCVLVDIYQHTFNPLTTEFFPPRQHIFMHSAHTTFVGTPLPQHSLLSGQTWWGPHTWRDPSGNTVNDIHDPPQGQQSEVKGGCQPDFRPAFP